MVLADQMWTEMLWDLASFIACSLQVLTHDVIRISFYSPFITDSKSWHRCLLSCLSVYQEDGHFRHCYLWLFSLSCCKYSWTRFCVDTRFLLSWVCAREWDVIQNDSPIHLVWLPLRKSHTLKWLLYCDFPTSVPTEPLCCFGPTKECEV